MSARFQTIIWTTGDILSIGPLREKSRLIILLSPRLVNQIQYIPRNMHTVFALLCFVVVIHWLIFPYPSGLLHWHCGNLTIAPVPAKQPWWIWINTSCEFIMNDCITTTKQSTTKPCAYFLGYTVHPKRIITPGSKTHYDDVIMTKIASQITSLTVVYWTVYPDVNQRRHKSSASLAFVWGIHPDRWIPRTKGQLCGKCFHLMTSSWSQKL